MNGIQKALLTNPKFPTVDLTIEESVATTGNIQAVDAEHLLLTGNHQTSNSSSEVSDTDLQDRKTTKHQSESLLVSGNYHQRSSLQRKALKNAIGKEKFREIVNLIENSYINENPLNESYYIDEINKYLTKKDYPTIFSKYGNNKEFLAYIFYSDTEAYIWKAVDFNGNKISEEEHNELRYLKSKINRRYHTRKKQRTYTRLMHINIDDYHNLQRISSTDLQSADVNFTPKEKLPTAFDIKTGNVAQTLMTENHQTRTSTSEMNAAELQANKTDKNRRSKIMRDRRYYHRDSVHRGNLKKTVGKERYKKIINLLDDAFSQKKPMDKAYFMENINKYLTKEKYPALFMKYDNNKEFLAEIFCSTNPKIRKTFDLNDHTINKEEYKELTNLKYKINCKYHTSKRKSTYTKLNYINIDECQSLENPLQIYAHPPSDGENEDKTTETNKDPLLNNFVGLNNNDQLLHNIDESITTENSHLYNVDELITTENSHLYNVDELITTDNPLLDNFVESMNPDNQCLADELNTDHNLLSNNFVGLNNTNNPFLDYIDELITPDNQFLDDVVNKLITDDNPHFDDIDGSMTPVNPLLDNVELSPVITNSNTEGTTSANAPLSITLSNGLTVTGINESNIASVQKLLEIIK